MSNFYNFLILKKKNKYIVRVVLNTFNYLLGFSANESTSAGIMQSLKIFFKKFNFKGKTFRLRIYKNKIKFLFNKSHKTYMLFNNLIKFKKLKKTKFKLNFIMKNDLNIFKHYIKKIRMYNIFTSRGIKLGKDFFFKKKGKISTYR